MAHQDPENNEPRALFSLVDFNRRNVLEIGCGDGRLTWRYAEKTAHVTAIDAFEQSIITANASKPEDLKNKVDFQHKSLDDFVRTSPASAFDIVILAWSF